MSKIKIYCDGGSRGNPGPAASAFVVIKDDKEIFSQGFYLGEATNNVAEYNAVKQAFKWLKESDYLNSKIEFVLDSEFIVKQLKKEYKIKAVNLKPFADYILTACKDMDVTFTHVTRDKNTKADALVNETLDQYSS